MSNRGFGNVGNTCGLNALLQCIAHTDALREFFLNDAQCGTIADNCKYSIVDELKRLLREFWVDNKSLIPRRFAKAFEEATQGRIAMGEQMDMSEVFIVLQEKFENEWKKGLVAGRGEAGAVEEEAGPWSGTSPLMGQATDAWRRFMSNLPERWTHLVNGLQVGQVMCDGCKHIYHNFEPFTVLSLEIPKPTSPGIPVHLGECFKAYFDTEHLDNAGWKCDKCNGCKAEKLVRFWQAPKVMVVVLKRFRYRANGRMEKMHTPVNIPETFNFLPGTELAPGKLPTYKLQAIGTHFGSLNSGHYTALARHEGRWHHFDDLSINALESADMVLKNNIHAYMLFYERD